jgi:glc operon protein GlcG
VAAFAFLAPAAHAQLPSTPYIGLDAAKRMAAAAEAEARQNGWTVAIAVVDAAGGLILFQREDDTQPASVVTRSSQSGATCFRGVRRARFSDA